jgi:hypothetical protein
MFAARRRTNHIPSASINSRGGSPRLAIPTPPTAWRSRHTITKLPRFSCLCQSLTTAHTRSRTPGFILGDTNTFGDTSSIADDKNPWKRCDTSRITIITSAIPYLVHAQYVLMRSIIAPMTCCFRNTAAASLRTSRSIVSSTCSARLAAVNAI